MDYKYKYEKLIKDLKVYFEQRTELMSKGQNMGRSEFDKIFSSHQTLDAKLRKISGASKLPEKAN